MKIIGKGSFTTAYFNETTGQVLLKSRDRVKAAMAEGFFPDHKIFPKIKFVSIGDGVTYYEMKYYKKYSSLKNNLTSRQWEFYKLLRTLNHSLGYANIYRDFETKIPNKFQKEREALLEALNGLSNYGTDIAFEISPRNVAIEDKKLILLDCFFFQSCLFTLI